jgi:hypothetical protein
VKLSYSSRASECRSSSSLSSKSEKKKVEAVASVSAQAPENFVTSRSDGRLSKVNVLRNLSWINLS